MNYPEPSERKPPEVIEGRYRVLGEPFFKRGAKFSTAALGAVLGFGMIAPAAHQKPRLRSVIVYGVLILLIVAARILAR